MVPIPCGFPFPHSLQAEEIWRHEEQTDPWGAGVWGPGTSPWEVSSAEPSTAIVYPFLEEVALERAHGCPVARL